MKRGRLPAALHLVLAASVVGAVAPAKADAITDWNSTTHELIGQAKIGTPPAVRIVALVQTAAFEAAHAAAERYPGPLSPATPATASVEAAVAAAHRALLVKLLPAQQTAVEATYHRALAVVPDGPHKAAGLAIGDETAAAVLARRSGDRVGNEDYRPQTTPGVYVPTASPAAFQWPQRQPWLMAAPNQFRPGPPPALDSDLWARDFNEVRTLGGKNSSSRSPEQTVIANFWEYSLPAIYHGLVRSVAEAPGRDIVRNARLFATVSQAMDDAMISVFDAKYHYNFWRPATAIRNGDLDGHPGTPREAGWVPFIETPMHPEYPCAHCILAGSVAAVIEAEAGGGATPTLATTSPSARGAVRRWESPQAFAKEVANARIYDGVHFRNSTEVGLAMGRRIGELAATRLLRPDPPAYAAATAAVEGGR